MAELAVEFAVESAGGDPINLPLMVCCISAAPNGRGRFHDPCRVLGVPDSTGLSDRPVRDPDDPLEGQPCTTSTLNPHGNHGWI